MRIFVTTEKVAFSPDGKKLIHAGLDRAIHVWDVMTGKELTAFKGHRGTIHAVAFSPDGKLLASASADTTALVWDFTRVLAASLPIRDLTKAEIESRWAALMNRDGAKAFAVMQDLFASPKETVVFLAQRLKPAAALDMTRMEKLTADLGSSQFKVRQNANQAILRLGEQLLPVIDKALAAKPPIETKTRLELLRTKLINRELTGEQVRVSRAVEVLEGIGSPEARNLLRALAKGAPGAFSTMAAQEALSRVVGR